MLTGFLFALGAGTLVGHDGCVEHGSVCRRLSGIIGGLLAMSFAGTTLLARWSVPRYGSVKVLFLELAGGHGSRVPARLGPHSQPPDRAAGWLCVMALGAGAVLAASFFFTAVKRIAGGYALQACRAETFRGARRSISQV